MAIEGKVARLLNERDLAINRGANAGVKEGMKFKVVEGLMPVEDPDSGEELGSLNREKIRVKVVEVQPKFCIAKTYETYVVNLGGEGVGGEGSNLGFDPSWSNPFRRFLPRREVTRVRTLRGDEIINLGPMPMDEKSSFVKVGDPVIQLEDEV